MRIKVEENPLRIDLFLSKKLNLSRSKIQSLVKASKVLVNQEIIKANYLLKLGDIIELEDDYQEKSQEFKSKKINLNIIYEDEYLLVLNKESGVVVHPAEGTKEKTLSEALLEYTSLSTDSLRPGIVHRLDKDTSGLLLIAKTNEIHQSLIRAFKEHRVLRKYVALVEGIVTHETGTINAPIGRDPKTRIKMAVQSQNSKEATTHFTVLKRFATQTLLELTLETGRTHQIRVHLQYINHPVVNDPVYGKSRNEFGQALHAYYLSFEHPVTKEQLSFEAPAPKEFEKLCK